MEEKEDRIRAFKTRADSLRVSASRVSAFTGYHPYAVLPELFLDLVYQGRVGQELRVQDARELGMVLISADVMLLELAKKAGADTSKALESAIQVKDGATKLDNVKVAETLKKKVLDEAKKSKKLTPDEIKKLAEGTRSYVDTGFGTHHEDEALDLFEKQCGWQVRERNASILNWPFARAVSESADLTVNPMGPPKARDFTHRSKADAGEAKQKSEKDSKDDKTEIINTKEEVVKLATEIVVQGETAKVEEQELNETKAKEEVAKLAADLVVPTGEATKVEEQPKPFFIISGAVDGVRDELWCPPDQAGASEFDENWELRTVIVECKHRMRRAYNTPPLYDQIQTTVYCLMYGTEQADILQVMRKEKKQVRPAKRRKEQPPEDTVEPGQKKLEEFLETKPKAESGQKVQTDPAENKENEPKAETDSSSKPPPPAKDVKPDQTIDIFVSRMTLQDQVMNHRHHWHTIILPRLRSFVDAVYHVRADDDARKLLLEVVANEEQTGYATHVSWDILHQHCPWLKDCDTALRRN